MINYNKLSSYKGYQIWEEYVSLEKQIRYLDDNRKYFTNEAIDRAIATLQKNLEIVYDHYHKRIAN